MSFNQELRSFLRSNGDALLLGIVGLVMGVFIGIGIASGTGSVRSDAPVASIESESEGASIADLLVDPNQPLLNTLEVPGGSYQCGHHPEYGYEKVLQAEIEYLNYLVETGSFPDERHALKAKNSELHELRNFCIDNDPETDAEKKERFAKAQEFRWERYNRARRLEDIKLHAELGLELPDDEESKPEAAAEVEHKSDEASDGVEDNVVGQGSNDMDDDPEKAAG